MQINENCVAVDNDFINHIAESKLKIEVIIQDLKALFAHFGLIAVIHPLVYKNEVPDNNVKLNQIFQENVIEKIDFDDIFDGDDEKKIYYIYVIRELYSALTGESLGFSDDEIFTKWIRERSLGELHSITMCLVCGSKMFLSDDKDSKSLQKYANQKFIDKITVYNRKEIFEEYIKTGGTDIKRADRVRLAHVRC